MPEAVQVRLAYLGAVISGADVERLMNMGFDLVCVGRALLHDPQMANPLRAEQGWRSASTHCNLCVASMATPPGARSVLAA